jgi:parallel beta-helix repeat protein
LDRSRHVVLGADPDLLGTIEVTVRRHWVTGTSSADNVTVEGFAMKHAATEWRCGALQAHAPSDSTSLCRFKGDGDGWTVRDNNLSHAHGALVSVRGDNNLIENNTLTHAGQLGIHNAGSGSVVRGNEVSFNNTENFCVRPSEDYCDAVNTDGVSGIQGGSPLTESGGMKIAGGKSGLTVDGNHVHHNHGNGIWFDVGSRNAQITNNVTHHNTRRGIFWEISYGAEIAYNTVYENGWGTPEGLNGPGLEVGTSDGANVHDNVIAWNAYGILVKCSSGRDNASCENNFVHDNTIIGQSPRMLLGWNGQSSFFDTTSNRGEGNDYWYSSPEPSGRFAWKSSVSTLSAFNATHGEEGGRYLTTAEKDTIAANKNIPANPEPR